MELVRDKGLDVLGYLTKVVREIAELLDGFEQDSHAMPIHITSAGVDQRLLCGAQEKVLHEFLVGIRGFKAWIVALHACLPIGPDEISQKSENRQF
jgi:hypothetical protein